MSTRQLSPVKPGSIPATALGPASRVLLHRKSLDSEAGTRHLPLAAQHNAPVPPSVHKVLCSSGKALDSETRAFMEPLFGHNFSGVRVHTDAGASALNHALSASACTIGQDIFFRDGHYNPGSSPGRALLAHELTHVLQQNNGPSEGKLGLGTPGDHYEQEADAVERAFLQREQSQEGGKTDRATRAGAEIIPASRTLKHTSDVPLVQRRLVAFGTLADVNALLGLIGPRAGLTLQLNVANNQVRIAAVLPAAPPSPALRAQLTGIINHATQHAEVIIARGQPQVQVGAFPQPSDLTVTRVQQIDIDDILKIEGGAAGNGVAKAAHEIQENFVAHAAVPTAGTDLFAAAHQAAIATESAVTAELVGPGRRVADVSVNVGPGRTRTIQDFENYYLVYRTQLNAATQDVAVTSARRRPKVVISTRTIDNFGTGFFSGATIPATGPAIIAAAAADVAANPTATVRIEGFADSSELVGGFRSTQRATNVQTALVAAGVGRGRIHFEGRGGTSFVAPNNTPLNRARNRRVVITVTRPGP